MNKFQNQKRLPGKTHDEGWRRVNRGREVEIIGRNETHVAKGKGEK